MSSVEAQGFAPNLAWFDDTYASRGKFPVAVFDFDGVLCAPEEDLVYKLEVEPEEKRILEWHAGRFGLDPAIYDLPYLRHLVFQELLREAKSRPAPGPLLKLAQALSNDGRPFFILTARSGRAAVARALDFLDKNALVPQETFFVGRVAKGRQLRMIRETVSDARKVVYFDDSLRHARNSRQQDFVGFTTVHLLWGQPHWEKARKLYHETLARAGGQSLVSAA